MSQDPWWKKLPVSFAFVVDGSDDEKPPCRGLWLLLLRILSVGLILTGFSLSASSLNNENHSMLSRCIGSALPDLPVHVEMEDAHA
jgi:hypothetical protein